jgi:hypothetical protein
MRVLVQILGSISAKMTLATRISDPRVVRFDPAGFPLMVLVSGAVDTELHARLGSRTGICFIAFLSQLAAESPLK